MLKEKLGSLPFKKVAHQVTTIDAQPIIGVDDNQAVALMITGQLKAGVQFIIDSMPFIVNFEISTFPFSPLIKADDDPPHSFHHTFLLRPAGGAFVVSNEIFRLALHN